MTSLSMWGPFVPSRPATPPSPAAGDARTVTVASVPASHVYVRHIAARHDDGVRRLPDPAPEDHARSTEQTWWPPVMLRPEWVSSHDFDVLHLHFGFDAWQPDALAAVVDAVHAQGRRFVHTVHDLRSPSHATRTIHHEQLAALLQRADDVITLTPGAAREIERRWGRQATVLPHPHVVPLTTMRTLQLAGARLRRRRDSGFRVGLHLKSLQPSMDPMAILPTLVETVAEIPGATLQVNGHTDLLHPAGARYDHGLSRFLCGADTRGRLDLRVHDHVTHDQLWAYLVSLDVSVLPYRFGTHSAWLEACRDLGTSVVAPTCGYYADQGPVHSYVMDEEHVDPESLRRAVHAAYDQGPADPVTVEQRIRQRDELAARHRELYLRGADS